MKNAGVLTEVRVLGRSLLMRQRVPDSVSVITTIHLMVQCLRFPVKLQQKVEG